MLQINTVNIIINILLITWYQCKLSSYKGENNFVWYRTSMWFMLQWPQSQRTLPRRLHQSTKWRNTTLLQNTPTTISTQTSPSYAALSLTINSKPSKITVTKPWNIISLVTLAPGVKNTSWGHYFSAMYAAWSDYNQHLLWRRISGCYCYLLHCENVNKTWCHSYVLFVLVFSSLGK